MYRFINEDSKCSNGEESAPLKRQRHNIKDEACSCRRYFDQMRAQNGSIQYMIRTYVPVSAILVPDAFATRCLAQGSAVVANKVTTRDFAQTGDYSFLKTDWPRIVRTDEKSSNLPFAPRTVALLQLTEIQPEAACALIVSLRDLVELTPFIRKVVLVNTKPVQSETTEQQRSESSCCSTKMSSYNSVVVQATGPDLQISDE